MDIKSLLVRAELYNDLVKELRKASDGDIYDICDSKGRIFVREKLFKECFPDVKDEELAQEHYTDSKGEEWIFFEYNDNGTVWQFARETKCES